MKWLNNLEMKYKHLAIHDLMKYVMGISGIVFILSFMDKTGMFMEKLYLIPSLVIQGEIWRLISYIFIPPSSSPIWILFMLYFYYMIGNSLESEWGSFKFNIYYLVGMVGTTLAAFVSGGIGTSVYLNSSLFLAFAKLYPDYEFLLFGILPIKSKYLAFLDWIFILYAVAFGSVPEKLAAIASVLNFFVFFGKDMVTNMKSEKKSSKFKKELKSSVIDFPTKNHFHKCTICGKTENDDPNMDFRYCSLCEGDYEYCMDHLKNHEHIKKP